MRTTLLILSCFSAAACLAVSLRGAWAEADGPDGTRYEVSLRKVSHVAGPAKPGTPREDCDYLRAKGKVQLCAPAEYGDAPFSMLCSVFTLMLVALGLALASGTLAVVSPYRAKGIGAQLAGASFIAALLGTVLAQAAMSRALAVLEGLPMQFGGLAFSSAWCAIGLLLFAAGLSTTSMMLGHH
jgi:hypothetical protein